MVIGKILEEFAVMQSQFNLLSKEVSHLKNDNLTQPTPGFNPGHVLLSEELEHHNPITAGPSYYFSD
ncbi:hypothetical protein DSO57_1039085 [Entomophthora muscae]|uniref:Uncharacterized protein n=1 Tax=Entomophthora muscae TaxID=34485 RepID=A0ACC2SBI6_9FUNG|nr:hypothetical protein DSO57_1039085 [Entomophthora muscae]